MDNLTRFTGRERERENEKKRERERRVSHIAWLSVGRWELEHMLLLVLPSAFSSSGLMTYLTVLILLVFKTVMAREKEMRDNTSEL